MHYKRNLGYAGACACSYRCERSLNKIFFKFKVLCEKILTFEPNLFQNEEMAKRIVPAFGRLLATVTEEAAIKNNIVYALSDMCVRYASLVTIFIQPNNFYI